MEAKHSFGTVPPPGTAALMHRVSATCNGERCRLCSADATHKVGEMVPHDRPEWHQRHSFTAYVCCGCFGRIFGQAAMAWCDNATVVMSDA